MYGSHQIIDFSKKKNEFFSVGNPEQAEHPPGKIWKGTKVKNIEIHSKSKCIRCITINGTDEGSKSKRNCEVGTLKFRKGEFLEEIHCRIPYGKSNKNKTNVFIHYIEFRTNFKRKVHGGIPEVGKKLSHYITVKGRIGQFQTFFKGKGGTLKGLKIRIVDPLEEEKITPEEEERLNFIVDEMGDFPITLKNREITLWKSLIIRKKKSSKVNEEILKGLELEVDETNILCFLLGKKMIEIEPIHLIDYYLLFKYLDCEVEMLSVLEMTTKITSFDQLYQIFQKCLFYEPSFMLSSLSPSSNPSESELFEHSFTSKIYYQMKQKQYYLQTTGIQRLDTLDGGPLKTLMDKSGTPVPKDDAEFYFVDERLELLVTYMSSISSSPEYDEWCLHKDISLFKRKQKEEVEEEKPQPPPQICNLLQTYKNHTKTLEEKKRKRFYKPNLHNVVFRTSDNEEVKCVLEYLIGKYEIFFHMISFGGMEVSELKQKGSISLTDLSRRELTLLLRYCCLNRIEESSIHILISVYAHCEKYTDWKLMKVIGSEIQGLMKRNESMTRKRMEKILYFSAPVLKFKHLQEKIIPILATAGTKSNGLDEKEIKRMLKKETKIRDLEARVEELEKKVEELEGKKKKEEEEEEGEVEETEGEN